VVIAGGAGAAGGGRGDGPAGRLVLSVAIVGLLLAACGSSTSGTTSTSGGPTSSPTVPSSTSTAPPTTHPATTTVPSADRTASAGCGSAARAGSTTIHPGIAGHQRVAIVHVPSGYRDTTAAALVLDLHGSRSTARQQEVFSRMDTTADAHTFIVVYPQGGIPAASGFEWNVPGQPLLGGGAVPAGAPDDVAFLEQLVAQLERAYCVDRALVDATGFSGGARMASQLGCDAASLFAAVAPVSGLRFPSPCASTRPVPVVSFHGTADPVDPYNGNGQAYWTYSVPTAASRWGTHNGCAATPTSTVVSGGVVLTAYGSCHGGAAVELYTIPGEGHEWPGGPKEPRRATRLLGPQSTAISANEVMWSFFTAHPLS
jgi:polyhydroxybutyrate depolymerase